MSLFRRDLLYASIEVDRVALVRLDDRRALRDDALVPVALDLQAPEHSLRTLGNVLSSSAWRAIDRHVVLSDRLVRYLVVERPEGVRTVAELRLACAARLQSSFDLTAEAWHLAIDLQLLSTHYLVCAIPHALLEAVRSVFGTEGRLLSLRPYLVSELRRCARALPEECWFVACARDSVAIAAVTRSGCRNVRVTVCDRPSAPIVEDLLAREGLLIGEPCANAPAIITGTIDGAAISVALRRLDADQWANLPADRSADYRLALSELWM